VNKAEHRGLAGPGVPGQEGELALFQVEGNVANREAAFRIFLRYVREFDHRIRLTRDVPWFREGRLDMERGGVKAGLGEAPRQAEGLEHGRRVSGS